MHSSVTSTLETCSLYPDPEEVAAIYDMTSGFKLAQDLGSYSAISQPKFLPFICDFVRRA